MQGVCGFAARSERSIPPDVNTLLVSFGLLLIATAITLMAAGPRTWLVAVAQGIGVQALIGAMGSAVQIAWFMEGSGDRSALERVVLAVQGLPFVTGGWSAQTIFTQGGGDRGHAVMDQLDSYLPIAAIQIAVVGVILSWRKMQEERLTDPVQLLVLALLIANTACGVQWAWWG